MGTAVATENTWDRRQTINNSDLPHHKDLNVCLPIDENDVCSRIYTAYTSLRRLRPSISIATNNTPPTWR